MSVYVCDWVIFVCFRTQNGISMTPIAVFMPLCLRVYSCARFGCFSLSFFLCLSCWERRRCMHSEFGIVSIWNGTYWTIQFCYSSAFCRLFTTQIDNRNKSNRRTPCSPNKCRISQWEILTQLALLWFNADRENLLFTLDDFSSDIFARYSKSKPNRPFYSKFEQYRRYHIHSSMMTLLISTFFLFQPSGPS